MPLLFFLWLRANLSAVSRRKYLIDEQYADDLTPHKPSRQRPILA